MCPFVGASDALVAALQQLRQVARCEAPVLIEGETGTGKELAARAIHYGGARRDGPFVPVNCGAIPETLVESELFGHERGAFTDAREKRTGLVAEARGGTLFLDEVDALNARAQVTLLRFLQDQRYRPVGTPREQRGDVRVIASTNRPLDALAEAGQFRADLLYRLKVLHLVMPPLRDRGDDAVLLAHHFVARFVAQYRMPTKTLHPRRPRVAATAALARQRARTRELGASRLPDGHGRHHRPRHRPRESSGWRARDARPHFLRAGQGRSRAPVRARLSVPRAGARRRLRCARGTPSRQRTACIRQAVEETRFGPRQSRGHERPSARRPTPPARRLISRPRHAT